MKKLFDEEGALRREFEGIRVTFTSRGELCGSVVLLQPVLLSRIRALVCATIKLNPEEPVFVLAEDDNPPFMLVGEL